MDRKTVKRNYFSIVYKILKKESSKKGKHFTADKLCEIIEQRYGVRPDRKTIYTTINDLITFGFDVKVDKESATKGYYLDKREVTRHDFYLIVDGINSISDLPIDNKLDIIENLCNVLGYDYNKVGNYEYDTASTKVSDDGEESRVDYTGWRTYNEYIDNLDIIINALMDKKCIELKDASIFKLKEAALFDFEDDFKAYLGSQFEKFGNNIILNPHQLFRNNKNYLFLLCYYKFKKICYPFAFPISSLANIVTADRSKDRPDRNIFSLDLANFYDANTYRNKLEKKEITLNITFGIHPDSELFRILTSYFLDYQIMEEDGKQYIKALYQYQNENDLMDIILNNHDYIIVKPGSSIFDNLQWLATSTEKYRKDR